MIRNMYMRVISLASVAALLAGCGGGAGPSGSSALPGTTKTPNTATATFVVKIPAKSLSASARTPHYITSNVKAIDFSVTQPGNPTASTYAFYPLTPQSTYCTSGSSGLTCTLAVVAQPGADQFVVNLYDATTAYAGYIIATGVLAQTISAQASNTISITTNGVPSYAMVGIANPYPATGAATSTPISLVAVDADGDLIVGSYDMPLTLSDSDTSGTTTLSKTSFAQAGDSAGLTLNYTGAALPSGATLSLTSASLDYYNGNPITRATYSPGSAGPLPSPVNLDFATSNSAAQTVTVTGSAGSNAPYALNVAQCSGIVTISGSAPTFTVTPVVSTSTYFNGPCQLVATDSNGHSTNVNVIVGL